jgi:uncharacterized protein with GYD domain
MSTYVLFGKYSPESIKEISAGRTQKARQVIADSGGSVKSGYAMLGEVDLLVIADFPSNDQAMKASVGLAKLLGVGFTTAPAVSMDEFDKLVG